MLADSALDGNSCATPVKKAFGIVEDYASYSHGSAPMSSRRKSLENNHRNQKCIKAHLMLKTFDSEESLQDDDPYLENSEESFSARRRSFMTAQFVSFSMMVL